MLQWVSKWSIWGLLRDDTPCRRRCIRYTRPLQSFPCPSKLCFSIKPQGATPPWFHGPFFLRKLRRRLVGWTIAPTAAVDLGAAVGTHPLPCPLLFLNSSHPDLQPQQVTEAYLVVWSRPLYLNHLKSWYSYSCQSRDVAHLCPQLPGNARRGPCRLPGFLIYPPCLLCVKTALHPPAAKYRLLLTVWCLFFLCPGSWARIV